jgi:hypothetical protein
MPMKEVASSKNESSHKKLMVWLSVCSKGVTPLVILDEETVDHDCYIKKVLPVALQYGNKVFGDDWIFQ